MNEQLRQHMIARLGGRGRTVSSSAQLFASNSSVALVTVTLDHLVGLQHLIWNSSAAHC